jgi:formylglycine-generating enzyme required for sulfatase activity
MAKARRPNTPEQELIDRYIESLLHNPDSAAPADMSPETVAFVRNLVRSETVGSARYGAQQRIWLRALADARTQISEQAKQSSRGAKHNPLHIRTAPRLHFGDQLALIAALIAIVAFVGLALYGQGRSLGSASPTLSIAALPTLTSEPVTNTTFPAQATFVSTQAVTQTASLESAMATVEASTTAPRIGTSRVDTQGITQVWVPAGCFTMGSDPAIDEKAQPNEQPAHEVCLTQGYWLDQTEVTNTAYQKFVDAGGYKVQRYWSAAGWQWLQTSGLSGPRNIVGFTALDQPRLGISWYEADAYAHWRGGQLPSEAQWEYAARGPQSLVYPWGNDYAPDRANVAQSLTHTAPVGSYPMGDSWIGAKDMIGNSWEWTADYYGGTYYSLNVKTDPSGPAVGDHRVAKGGSWDSVVPLKARAAFRNAYSPASRDNEIGFRVLTPAS